MLAFLLDLLDATIVSLAAPAIRAGLGASSASVQWLLAGYALGFSMLLIVGGRLGDVYGYRAVFLAGVAGFAATSLACGVARTADQLVLARVLQGGAAAMMAPQMMSMVQLLYRPEQRGPVMGLFGTLGGLGAALGPVLGGLLIHADLFGLAWRPIFLINLPVAAVALIGGAYALPPGRAPHPPKPDLPGAGLVMLAVFLLIFPLIEGPASGWPAWSFALLAACPIVFALYAAWIGVAARRGVDVLTPPALFGDRAFVGSLLVMLGQQVALGGYFLVFPLTLQLGLGYGVLAASLISLPFPLGVSLGMVGFGRRFGVPHGRRLVRIGTLVLMLGWACLIATLRQPVSLPALGAALLVSGLGMGLFIGPLSGLALARVDIGHAGAASGVFSAVQQLGAALGAAGIGAVYFAVQLGTHGAAGFRAALPPALALALLLLGFSLLLTPLLPARIAARPSD